MADAQEVAFLRSIAEEGADDTTRLVYADWLEERGDAARAEFLRVGCELERASVSDERRDALRVRQRELLDVHRQDWIEAIGLPLEDVRFDRGLVVGARLSKWDLRLLVPDEHPQFATGLMSATELDLSGLKLKDHHLAAFANSIRFPALRRLLLADNALTDAGAAALAAARGVPRLGTVYLSGTRVGDAGRAALERAAGFRLGTIDLGACDEGYCMTHAEADLGRRKFIRGLLLKAVAKLFKKYKLLRSAALIVAQYWADEADDAVHGNLVVSELPEPTLAGVHYDAEPGADPNIPNTRIKPEYGKGSSSLISLYGPGVRWDDNSGAIPLWAAFAPENGHQEYRELSEVYAPAVLFYRHGGYDILPRCRPHLDGVRPEWEEED